MFLNGLYSRILSIGEVQRQSVISFTGQLIFTFIGFLSTMYFAHTVGSSVLGEFFLFTAYYGIINMISDGGFGGAAIKRISEGEEQNEYFSAFFMLRSLFVLVVIFALIFYKSFIYSDEAAIITWLSLALIASLIDGSITTGIAGTGKMGIHATGNFVNNVSRIAIQVGGVFLGYGVAGLIGGFIAGMLIASIMKFRFFNLHFVRYTWMHVKSLSSFSFWLFLTSSGVLLYSYADTVMIGYYLNDSDVGIYRVVFQFTSLAVISTTALRATLWPKVSRWGKIGEIGLIEKSLSRAFTYSFILAIPVLAGGILLGKELLYYFYGSEFETGYLTLVVLLLVQVVNVFQFFLTMYLGALNRQKDAFKVTSISAIANVILNLILIPVIGIEGAAISTFVTMSLNAILAKRKLSEIMNVQVEYLNIVNTLKAASLMSVLIVIFILVIPLSSIWRVIILVIGGALIYTIALLKYNKQIYNDFKEIAIRMNFI